MDFIKANFQFIIICILACIILFERSCQPPTPTPAPTVITIVDTSWKHMVQPITNVYPTVTNHIPAPAVPQGKDTMWIPSPNDSILRVQYQNLRDSLLSANIYTQTLKYDSSSVILTDTVTHNRLTGRSYSFNLKYPVVTTTTTIKEPYIPKAQVYVGGGITGGQTALLHSAELGVMYKSKKDQIFGVKGVQQFNGATFFTLDSYWKIKLHK